MISRQDRWDADDEHQMLIACYLLTPDQTKLYHEWREWTPDVWHALGLHQGGDADLVAAAARLRDRGAVQIDGNHIRRRTRHLKAVTK